jgi:hypothetical protein
VNIKLILILSTTLFSSYSFAQLSGASLFPEMKASNPAVLSGRPSAVFSLTGAKDSFVKEQDLSSYKPQ